MNLTDENKLIQELFVLWKLYEFQKIEIVKLKTLVKEMGNYIPLAISDRLDGWQAAKNSLAEIINRSDFKAIMEKQ